MVLWWLLIEHSKSRVAVVFFCLLTLAQSRVDSGKMEVKVQGKCK